jgi:hypothetical protein
MELIEIPHFTEVVEEYLTDDEYAALQWYLTLNPEIGDLVTGTGGARKVRWSVAGHGKRGGLRVIYFYRPKPSEIWMLTVYSKARKKDLTRKDKTILRQIIQEIKR